MNNEFSANHEIKILNLGNNKFEVNLIDLETNKREVDIVKVEVGDSLTISVSKNVVFETKLDKLKN
jgi:hypothetical protein